MHRLHLTQASILRPGIEELMRQGLDLDRYLRRSGIPAPVVRHSFAPITKRRHMWHFLDDLETGEGIETFGFLFGKTLDLTLFGAWGRHLLEARSLFEAFSHASRTIRHMAQGNSLSLTRRKGTATIAIVNEEPVTCHAADHCALKLLITLTELVADPGWSPRRATLRTGRLAQVEALPCFQDCRLRFEHETTSLDIPEDYLSRSLPDPRTEEALAEPGIIELPEGDGIAAKLQIVIATLLPYHGPVPAEEAAAFLGVSRTTLFRQLTQEGESYRRLVERVRYRAATRMLADPGRSVKEIAYTLGYHTPNNFIRAFRRVAGVPPGLFREQALESHPRVA